MQIPLFRVDAFTEKLFAGNPAAVCPLEEWLPDETMQAIALENNISETAFFVRRDEGYGLRWFSPRSEVNLCGHATLAAAFVILNQLAPELKRAANDAIRFETRSGRLLVRAGEKMLSMDFPALPPWPCEVPPSELLHGLGMIPEQVLRVKDNYFAVYRDEDQIRSLRPEMAEIAKLHPAGVCVTAPGSRSDFVSRYFVPSYGIPEDPVTGSTHCSLLPYWANRLGKNRLYARQISARGGELWCELSGDRVMLEGQAVLFLIAQLTF